MAVPVSASIEVRRPALELTSDVPHYWNGGDAFATHFMNALSSVFPAGEAFFVRSVMYYRDRVEDPELLERMRAFAGQEGQHAHQHDRHLAMLAEQGYPAIAARNRIMESILRWAEHGFPRMSLVATASLEHLTALLARRILSDPERRTGAMDSRMAALWQWHALEEAEHKAVAFDVAQIAAPQRWMRIYTLTVNTITLFSEILYRTCYMLWKDGVLFRRGAWGSGWRFLFGREGLLRGLGAEYRAYYGRSFHPDDIDDRALIAEWRETIASRSGR